MSRIRRYNATTRLWEYVDSILPGSTPIVSFTPQIVVTAPTGSTVTCVKGSTSITATEVSGVWTFNVTSYGEWTVTATNGLDSKIGTINVDSVKQYSIGLPLVPIEYTRVEYIEANGTQYIDTEFKPSDKTVFQSKLIYTVWGGGHLFGYQVSEGDSFRFFCADTSNTYLDYGSGTGGNRISTSYINSHDIVYELECGNRYIKDITIGATKVTASVVSFSRKTSNFRVFSSTDYGKIYYLRIYDDDAIVRNLVPCYRNSDDKPGMYDLVNNVFYTNAGTGEFIIPTT